MLLMYYIKLKKRPVEYIYQIAVARRDCFLNTTYMIILCIINYINKLLSEMIN